MASFLRKQDREGDGPPEQRSIDRINSFSDAVFAVAITLLILTIVVPEVSDIGQLPQELVDLWPKFLGFLISFLIIGTFWTGHHSVFGYLRRSTPVLLRINIFLLMFIVLLPFSTDLMSEYGDSRVAMVFYDINMASVALLMSLLWWYASYRKNLVDESLNLAVRKHILISYLSMALIFLTSIGIAFVNVPASQYLYLALIPNEIVLDRMLQKKTAGEAG